MLSRPPPAPCNSNQPSSALKHAKTAARWRFEATSARAICPSAVLVGLQVQLIHIEVEIPSTVSILGVQGIHDRQRGELARLTDLRNADFIPPGPDDHLLKLPALPSSPENQISIHVHTHIAVRPHDLKLVPNFRLHLPRPKQGPPFSCTAAGEPEGNIEAGV